MEALQNVAALRMACEHRLLRKMLYGGGAQSVVFGMFALVRGITATPTNALAKWQAAFGLFVFIEGLLILVAPRPSGLILEGLSFLGIGVWNLVLSAIGGSTLLAVLAFLQFIWGIQYFRRYPRFSILVSGKPPQATLNWASESVRGVLQLGSSESTDIVELEAPLRWKARLFQNAALFVSPGGREVLLLGKNEVQLQEGSYNGRTISVSLRLGSRVIRSAMTPRCHARLLGWLPHAQ
jgi:hypothetical protein